MNAPAVTFGRMVRGTGTEAGTSVMDVLANGERVGVIEAEMVDANERSSTRAKRWTVTGYTLILWTPDAESLHPVAADGPRAALARAKAAAVRLVTA